MRKKCLCQAMSTTLNYCRMFGFCPMSWTHINGICTYRLSKFWIAYTIAIMCLFLAYFFYKILNLEVTIKKEKKLLIAYLSIINENVLILLIIVMIFLNIFRVKTIARMYNKCSSLSRQDLLCQSNLKIYQMHHIVFITGFTLLYIIQYAAIFMLSYMENYDNNLSYDRLLIPVKHNTPLLFTGLVGTSCKLITTLMTCYEKLMMYSLKFSPVHPMVGFDETNENRHILGVYRYQRCQDNHKATMNLTRLEIIEYLKWLHEKIRECVDLTNDSYNPQLLMYMTFEIVSLVLHWYIVIIYFTTVNPDPIEATVNFFNWVFIIIHTFGLFIFLGEAQDIETVTKQILHIIIEFSTRISTQEEYQQIRIFTENLRNKRGLHASGIFNVNLGIAGPIAANILMYVLVAVQFKFPTK